MPLILASSSPRRKELLSQTNLDFQIIKPEIEERPEENEKPMAYVMRLAKGKAEAIREQGRDGDIIIAADTIVVLGDDILEKPDDEEHAFVMLRRLAGQTHQVITGVCICRGQKMVVEPVVTNVTFKDLSDQEINNYIARGESLDKAGAYGAQGSGAYFIRRIEGSYTNVVGLPMAEVCDQLSNFGIIL